MTNLSSGWVCDGGGGVVCADVFCVPQVVNLPRPLLFGLVRDAVPRHELVKHHDSDEHVHLRDAGESLIRLCRQRRHIRAAF